VNGTVEVSFVINEAGRVESAEVVKGLNAVYNAEALRVINAMPTWSPAKQGGKPVKCRLQMPMRFRNAGVEDAPGLK
jgi:protein TonB